MTNCILEIKHAGHFITIYKDSEDNKSIESIINYSLASYDLYNLMNIEECEAWENEIFNMDIVKSF